MKRTRKSKLRFIASLAAMILLIAMASCDKTPRVSDRNPTTNNNAK